MILLKLIRAVVLYIRYTKFEFVKDSVGPEYLCQFTDVPLKYRSTVFFNRSTKVGNIYEAIKYSRYTISDLL